MKRVAVGKLKVLQPGAILLFALAVAAPLPAQIEFHGEVYPLVRLTTDQRYLSLPHRFAVIEGQQRGESVSLYFSTALEYRLDVNAATPDMREAYAEINTGLGDFRFGKQILAWGAADGNNPTDNVNPYDFYYLFLPGTERKVGNVMATANLYLGPLNFEGVITPVFQPNRMPFGEEDFPLFDDGNTEDILDLLDQVTFNRFLENTETGYRVRLPMFLMDISFSYFRGFERMFTPQFQFAGVPPEPLLVGLTYNPVQVYGGDLVTFLGSWALRAEGAYFRTVDNEGTDPFVRNPYLQYVLQLDRMGDNINLVFQYLGTAITMLDGNDILNPVTSEVIYTEEENEKDNNPSRIGMPFAAIAQNAVMASASYSFADGRYELRGNTLYDLDHRGFVIGGGATLNLEEAFDVELGFVLLGGGEESKMHQMKDFSHLHLGLKYSF